MIESIQAHSLEQQGRLSWAPALANGAAILALMGLVGSVEDPDFALTGLWPALGLLATGLVVGLRSVAWFRDWATAFAEQAAHGADRLYSAAEVERNRALPQLPFDLDTATVIYGSREIAAKAIKDLWAAKIGVASEQEAFHRAEVSRIEKRMNELVPTLLRRGERTVFYGKVSVALCGLAFLWIMVAHELGWFQLAPT